MRFEWRGGMATAAAGALPQQTVSRIWRRSGVGESNDLTDPFPAAALQAIARGVDELFDGRFWDAWDWLLGWYEPFLMEKARTEIRILIVICEMLVVRQLYWPMVK